MKKELFIPTSTTRKKSFFLVLAAWLLLPIGVWAQYEDLEESPYSLWIAGTAVTDDNRSDVLSDGKATVSYDPESNMLTLNGAEVNGETSAKGCILSGLVDLTISLIGQSTIASSDTCTAILAVGQGPQTLTIVKGGDGCSLTFSVDRAIRGFSQATFTGLYWNGLYTYEYAETLPGYMLVKPDGTEAAKTVSAETYEVTSMPVLSDAQPYNLWICGYQVSSANADNLLGDTGQGTLSFDASTSTLTLDNVNNTLFRTEEQHPFILNGVGDLTIYLEGDNFLGCGSLFLSASEAGTASPAATVTTDASDRGSLCFSSPAEEWYSGHTVVFSSGLGCRRAFSENTQAYDYYIQLLDYGLTVGGVAVTSANAGLIAGNHITGGSVTFDSQTNTLTLMDASISMADTTDEGDDEEAPAIEYTGSEDLTIMLIGTNSVRGGWMEAIRCSGMEAQGGSPKIVFTTNAGAPGKLTCMGEWGLIDDYTNVEYQNGLSLSNMSGGQMIGVFTSYDLWVMGVRVTSVNKDDVVGDGTVRFNPQTSTLSFHGISLGDAEYADTLCSTSLPALTVDLHGNNIVKFRVAAFHSRNEAFMASLTFTTSSDNPGQLSWHGSEGSFTEGFTVTYSAPLVLQQSGNLISASEEASYGLTVGTTAVTSVNCTDVLGDGSVKFVPESQTLVLDNAHLDVAVASSLPDGLTIYLLGENSISGSQELITSAVANAPLGLITSSSKPGSLTLVKTEDEGTWISGFADPVVPRDYATTTDAGTMTIARAAPIKPIVAETENGEKPEAEVSTEDFGWVTWGEDPDTYVSVVAGNVLYTLRPGDFEEGDTDDPDDFSGVNLTEVPRDMASALSSIPGSDAYAEAFKGLTIQVPAGTGNIIVTGEIGTNAQLAVQIGERTPALFPNEEYPAVNQRETILVPYSCPEPTFVYIYLAQTTHSARFETPVRGRVITGHIRVSTVGASSSSVVSSNSYSAQSNTISNSVIAYDLPDGARTDDSHGIVMSTVAVSSTEASSRGARREAALLKKITGLGATVFDSVEKGTILYIDLSGTDIKDMTVNRSTGLFEGFSQNTLVYLPASNDDGGEDNVVLGDDCARLCLNGDADFRAHKDFRAASARLRRDFTLGQTATVFLPFSLSKAQADGLGTFHTFREISGAEAVFNEAETSGTAANTPYIFQPGADEAIAVTDVAVEGMDKSQAQTGSMVGTYEELLWADEQTSVYGFAATTTTDVPAGTFVRVGAGAWIPPFRAFMQVESAAPSRLRVVVGSVTTAIQTADPQRSDSSTAWFNVSGQRLSGTPTVKGLYINNNKKVFGGAPK